MGKGDKKTKRGKIHKGTFGVSRPRKSNLEEPKPKKPVKKTGTKSKSKAKS